MGENELAIKLVGDLGAPLGRDQWSINSVVTYKFSRFPSTDETTLFRSAWKQLRRKNANIASFVRDDDLIYEVPHDVSLHEWLSESFIVSHSRSGDLICECRPQKYLSLFHMPATSELALVTSHWRTDGIGIWTIWQQFFDAADLVSQAKMYIEL